MSGLLPKPTPDVATGDGDGCRMFVVTLSFGLVIYSAMVHLIPGFNLLYVPLGVVTTGLLLFVAGRVGLTAGDIGLERRYAGSGLRLGLVVAGIAAVSLVLAVAIPMLHPLFADDRVADFGGGLVAYRALIRIPLGTALLEEVAFRGILFGSWRRRAGLRSATIGSSVVFGLWHIRPAIDLLNANDLTSSVTGQVAVVTGAVLLTGIAGVVFCLLRIRSRSLVAPLIAHAAINSLALLAAAVVASS